MKKPGIKQTKHYDFGGVDGCVIIQVCREIQSEVAIVNTLQSKIGDPEKGDWAALCYAHGGLIHANSLEDAFRFGAHPKKWCPVCKAKKITPDDFSGKSAQLTCECGEKFRHNGKQSKVCPNCGSNCAKYKGSWFFTD